MNKSMKTIVILVAILLLIATALPAAGKSIKRRGSTYRTNTVEIFDIVSKKQENEKSGLIYYSIKAKVRNRTNHPVKITARFQAIDRSGYELEQASFYDKQIKARSTVNLTDRLVMQSRDYNNIKEWKVETLRIE